MKYYRLLLALLLLGLFLTTACSKAPEACMVVRGDKSNIQTGESLHFMSTCNTQDCMVDWFIQAPDQEVKIQRQSVKFTFQTEGRHEIQLIVSNRAGQARSSLFIDVN